MKQLYLIGLFSLLLGSFTGNAQITLNTCDAFTNDQDFTLLLEGVDATGRNYYQTNPITGDQPCTGLGVCEFRIAYNAVEARWEILADDGDADFTTSYVLYYNSSASTPNPPDLTLGTWEENIGTTTGLCNAVEVLTGDVQATLGGSNEAPVATAPGITGVQEDVPYALPDAIEVADADGDNLTLNFTITGGTLSLGTTGISFGGSGNGSASFTASGTLTDLNTALDAASFTSNQNLNGSSAGTITFVANDGITDSNTASVTFDIAAVNDAPVFTGLPTSITVLEDANYSSLNNALSSGTFSDVDAGSGQVVLYVSTTSGTFSLANPGGIPVSLTGNATSIISITGVQSAIEAYISINSNIVYNPAENVAGANAALVTLEANDNGNTGAGGGTNVTLGTFNINITPVNDDPTLTGLPTDITVLGGIASNIDLSAATFGDVDSGSGTVTLSLLVSGGTLSATSTAAVAVSYPIPGTMTLEGSAAAIENFLNTSSSIRYTSAPGATGDNAASLSLSANDNGNTGTGGGNLVSFGSINIDVITIPSISSVSVPANGSYSAGQNLDFVVNFSEAVVVKTSGGTPGLILNIGGVNRTATYLAGSGSTALVFRYTVVSGDFDVDGIEITGLSLYGGTIQSTTGIDANLTLNSVGSTAGVLVDTVAPSGYGVSFDTDPYVNSSNQSAVSFQGSSLEPGTILYFSISSSAGGTPVTGSQTVTTANQNFTNGGVGYDLSGLADGTLTLSIYLVDAAGNTGATVSTTIIKDTLAPSGYSVAWDDQLISASEAPNATFTVYGGEIGATIYYEVLVVLTPDMYTNRITASSIDEQIGVDLSSFSEGTVSIAVSITDVAGNEGILVSGAPATLDKTPPAAPGTPDLTAASDTGTSDTDNLTSITLPIFVGTAAANSEVRLYNGSTQIGSGTTDAIGNWSITPTIALAENTNSITATVLDAAGNESAASAALSVEIDVTPPATPGATDLAAASDTGLSTTDNITNDLMPALSGTAEAFAEVALTSDLMGALGTATADAGGNWSFTASTAMTAGIHTITATATDVAGNTSLSSPALTVTFDNLAPNLSLIAGLSLQLDANGITPVITASDLLATPVTDDFTVSTAIQLSIDQTQFDCSDTGANTVQVTATDIAGNKAVSTTTVQVVDLINPTIVAKSVITLNVGAFETVALTTAMIDEGSTDNCGIQSQVLSKTIFDRNDEGLNNVTYTVTDASGNPSQVTIAVTIVVIPKQLDVTVIAGQSKVYGDLDPVFSFTATGFEGGDDTSVLTGVLSREPGSNVGTYSINLGTLDAGPNYTINFTGADFEITPATLNISAAPALSKVYGDPDPELNYIASGLKNGDPASVITGSLSRTPGEDVGIYPINQGTLDAGGNYTINFIPSNFSITPADLLVTAENKTKVYGEADPAFTASYSGFVTGDTEAALGGSLSSSREPGENVGSYLITPAGLTSANYSISYATGALEITPADLMVTADNKTKIYGEADPAFTVSYAGFVNGDTEAALGGSLSFSREPGEDVASYIITASGYTSPNYTIAYTDGILTITQASQTITFEALPVLNLETDADFQLQATASSGLPVTYTYSYNTDVPAAMVTEGGFVSLVQSGSIIITASQVGNQNYLPATPVSQELNITSSDASVHSLTIGEQEYLNPGSLITYVMECGADVQSLDVSFITEANAQSTMGKNFSIAVPAPGIYRTTFTITSQDGTNTQNYTIEINKRFLFEEIVVQKFNNTLLVNNNPSTNGGYRFVGYRWYKNDLMVGNGQYFSEGDELTDQLDPLASYRVEMILENGDVLSTCAFNIELEATGKIQLAPNPVQANSTATLYADFDADELKDMKISIFSLQGTLIETFYTSSAKSAIQMPAGIQAGVYVLVCKTNKQTQTVQFIVH